MLNFGEIAYNDEAKIFLIGVTFRIKVTSPFIQIFSSINHLSFKNFSNFFHLKYLNIFVQKVELETTFYLVEHLTF